MKSGIILNYNLQPVFTKKLEPERTMSKQLLLMLLIAVSFLNIKAQSENPNYDKQLADSLGADEYGMRSYYLVILKTGPTKIEDKEKLGELFRGHFDNINKMAKEKYLVIAGPLEKNELSYRGIFILNARTEEEVTTLLKDDPTVTAGIFTYEIMKWYGSAAIPLYLKYHETIEKKKI